jgi:beta-glucosidase
MDPSKRPEFPSGKFGLKSSPMGTVVRNPMKYEQARHVADEIKHYMMNNLEIWRSFVSSDISKRGMQESDLLAFHLAISILNPNAFGSGANSQPHQLECLLES